MKSSICRTLLLALVAVASLTAMAQAAVVVSLPPPIVFAAPPELVVIPGTYAYALPDIDEDIFFSNGWWWRRWGGRWYRSHHYASGWGHYASAPAFYRSVPSTWRSDYRNHRWNGHEWNIQRIPHNQVQQNWSSWQRTRHWENQRTWGVQGYQRSTVRPAPRVAATQRQAMPQAGISAQHGVAQGLARPQIQARVNPQRQAVPQAGTRAQSQAVMHSQHQGVRQGSTRTQPQRVVTAQPSRPQGNQGGSHDGRHQR